MTPLLANAIWIGLALGTLLWAFALRIRERFPASVVLGVALLLRLPVLATEVHTNDLYRYVWEGRIQRAGFSPYVHAPDDGGLVALRDADHGEITHPHLTTIYPPLAEALFALAAPLGVDGMRDLFLWLDVAVVLLLLLWMRDTGRPPGYAIVYAWCPISIAASATGHVDPLMLLFLVAFAWAAERRRLHLAAGALALAILAKTMAAVLLPWLLLRRPRALLLVTLPLLVAGYAFYAAGDLFGTLRAFGSEFAFSGSLFRVAEAITPAAAQGIVVLLFAVLALAITLGQPSAPRAGVLLLAALLLCSPTVHFWYLTWFLVLLPALGRSRWTLPLLLWCATVLFSGATYRAQALGAPFEERPLLTLLVYLPPIIVALALAWRHWPRRAALYGGLEGVRGAYSVVIPARGEVENLRALLPAWISAGAERVIVADLPTGDGTLELCRGVAGVSYVPVERRGYGAAAREGLLAVRDANVVILCDADHHLGPRQASALLAPFVDPAVALVSAARLLPGPLPPLQRWGNTFVTLLIALAWGRRFHDLGPFRALRPRLLPPETLRSSGVGWNVEMNVRAVVSGAVIAEVALPASEREHGENRISGSFGAALRTGAGICRQLWRMREGSCARPS